MAFLFFLLLLVLPTVLPAQTLQVSVYATASSVARQLATPAARQAATVAMRRLGASKIYLEGRRGDEYVPPQQLVEARDHFRALGFQVVGAIATVAGKSFGVQENTPFVWLNWESPETRRVVANFFRENAAIFDEITFDDFYCTHDTSAASVAAKGGLTWAAYRQRLLTSLIESMILKPAREVNPKVNIVMKYPQWYDKFHDFGYDPARMSPHFSRIWVGTEVRNPETKRMGYTQPTMGYINFRWLSSIPGPPVHGAWFDHIECTAQNFVDQAWQSVLAGASELTLFSMNDVLAGHAGHELFIRDLPKLRTLADEVRGKPLAGVAYYKPSGSDADGDMFLMDYLAMLGLPVVPVSRYPAGAKVILLGVQAAADPDLPARVADSLRRGVHIAATPALMRKLGPGKLPAEKLDLSWNIGAFTNRSYEGTGERLLPPTRLPLVDMPRQEVDAIRHRLLQPLGVRFSAPSRVALYLIGGAAYLYNFRDEAVSVEWNGEPKAVAANAILRLR